MSLTLFLVTLLVLASATACVVIYRYYQQSLQVARLPDAVRFDDLEAQLALREARLVELERQRVGYEQAISDKMMAEADLAQIRQRCTEERQVLDHLQAELVKSQGERAAQELLRAEVAGLEGKLEHLSKAVETELARHAELSKDIASLRGFAQGAKDDVQRQHERLKVLESDIGKAQGQLQVLHQDIAKAEAEKNDAEAQARKFTTDLAKLTSSLETVKVDLAKAQNELLQATLRTEEERLKVESLQKQEKALEDSITALRLQLENLRKDIGKDASDDAEKFADLWQPVAFPNLTEPNNARELERLEFTKKYIASYGLVFPDRVLRSFHVALKTADFSPLTVLAGISGTGKSELPLRYAEGMGMYFSSLAVQPRWDSPQDLFGFYNHLERRYKATPLARAMAQFERHNRVDWPMPDGWEAHNDKHDRMLLVLLDEMNLARIEYYFSDFLSRLETRRGIGTEDPLQRAKAEIELDMGSLGVNEQAIRFFPDRNVLFTGTMNEDETTQSLSDKVLDRACVLRFGRPKRLDAQTRIAPGDAQSSALGIEQWMEWAGGPTVPALVDDSIQKLNDAMDRVQRPFAHRVAQAIRRYVANYGTLGASLEKQALADQIEQRILPKLRGLDVQEAEAALEGVRSVILATEDQVLLGAFEESKATGNFLWKGVDRS
jgi:outer membrane murein-binding lipoprotein Lpp